MTNKPITEITVNEESPSEARRILVSINKLRKDFGEARFKSDIESIYLLGCLLDKAEDAALKSMLDTK